MMEALATHIECFRVQTGEAVNRRHFVLAGSPELERRAGAIGAI
jgi:hypothetical protein